ncbi:Protein required for ethanol metabolism [Rhizina undulata]
MFNRYQLQLAKRPLFIQCATTGVLFATGDIIAQHVVERRGLPNHDYPRTLRMGFYGGFIFGPMVVKWYSFLQRRILIPNRPNAEIVARVALDQLVFTPINLTLFFSAMSLLEGGGPAEKLRGSFWTGLVSNWKVWPAVQLVNFRVVPLEYRLLVVNVVSLGWNSYLSYLNQQK